MTFNPAKHHRRSIRLQGFDYSQPGSYFLTVCTHHRNTLFGAVTQGRMHLSGLGKLAAACWNQIPNHFANVHLDTSVVMPNHIHGIITITAPPIRVEHIQPQRRERRSQFQHVIPGSIGSVIRSFKAAATREAHRQGYRGQIWQRNYFEHIIRDDVSFFFITEYIAHNPFWWSLDAENPHVNRNDLAGLERALIEKLNPGAKPLAAILEMEKRYRGWIQEPTNDSTH